MSSYRRNAYSGNRSGPSHGPAHDESQFTVPFKDAHPDSGEQPLNDIDQFIIPGRDDHGGHQTSTFNAPPLLIHQVDVAVRSNQFPYINREAFIRHAIVRHLRWLQEVRPVSMEQHMAPSIEAILERCFESQMRRKVKAAFDGLRETILKCEDDGEHMEVVRLVNYVSNRLNSVGKGDVWQRRAWQQFLDEFGHYINRPVESVPVGDGGEHETVGRVSNEVDDDDDGEFIN